MRRVKKDSLYNDDFPSVFKSLASLPFAKTSLPKEEEEVENPPSSSLPQMNFEDQAQKEYPEVDESVFHKIGKYLGDLFQNSREEPKGQAAPGENEEFEQLSQAGENASTIPSQRQNTLGFPEKSQILQKQEPPPYSENASSLSVPQEPLEEKNRLQASESAFSSSPSFGEKETLKPGEFTRSGSLEEVITDPDSKHLLSMLAGSQLSDKDLEIAEKYERAVDQSVSALDEEEKAIRDNIFSGNLSTKDKFFLGLALAAPVIISLAVGGREGLLTSAGSELSTLSKGIMDREKLKFGSKERIGKIGKERAELVGSLAKLHGDLQKSIPNAELRGKLAPHLVRIGKDKIGVEYNDFLVMKPKAVQSERDLKIMDKEAEALTPTLVNATNFDKTLDSFDSILDQLSDQGYADTVLTALPSNRQLIKVDGEYVDGSSLANQLRDLIADSYRRLNSMRGFTGPISKHIDAIIGNVNTWESYWSGKNVSTILKQSAQLRKEMRERVLNEVSIRGFYKEPLQEFYDNSSFFKRDLKNKILEQYDKGVDVVDGQWREVPS